ncbi:uncharacterized protein PITG_01720 [Phytophthora infestans T30-4]|uniref:Uncharacterized protein n=1 Tax=Phytophthora infestans (strain T30-4) TaxID=403677 RepID=D0MTX6_PHYIT|nr:uncharacterized protein PITG_01720 [Phytophthora infestans T30-4]EEY61423.1 conserved hypothetical protein [Phytophthora infestans T30-4]|eukprot:XP_002908340.1 conserved hypothetical protein [Phytophthora infestans T30-4]
MEVVALNERLRGDFSTLLKLLPPPYTVSSFISTKNHISSSKSPAVALPTARYTQHCRLMLWRLNSYQYGSASAFLLDLEQLERVAEPPELKEQVQRLLDRIADTESDKQGQENVVKETENNATWLCNVSLRDQIVTIGTFNSQEQALEGYEQQRKKMAENAASFNKLRQLGIKMEAEQREEDERVLKEAMAQCHPRLMTMKVAPVVPPAPIVNNTAILTKAISRSVVTSPAPSETEASPSRPSRSSKRQKAEGSIANASAAKKQKVESASNSASSSVSTSSRSYLKLRRLIQKRLCRHLKGQKVCVLPNPANIDEARWIASGRLEAGKVFSLDKKRQMTFADYVRDELGRPVSACAHMFLVRTKESIDDHLKVCDAFSDKERELGPPTQLQPAKSRKTSRRR